MDGKLLNMINFDLLFDLVL